MDQLHRCWLCKRLFKDGEILPLDGDWYQDLEPDTLVPSGLCPADGCGGMTRHFPSRWAEKPAVAFEREQMAVSGRYQQQRPYCYVRDETSGRICTLKRGHGGRQHVAHLMGEIVAVWDRARRGGRPRVVRS